MLHAVSAHVFRIDRRSISKWTTQLYREGVNERKCFTGVTRSRTIAACATVGPLAQRAHTTAVRAAAVAGLRRNLVNASVASCAAAGSAAPAGRRSMYAFYLFLHRGVARRRAAARYCKTLLRSRFLRSRASEKLLRHDAGYTDLALESRPFTGFYTTTTPRNGVIAIEAEFTKISVAFCACIPNAFFLSLRNNRVIDRSGGSSNGIVVS